MRHIFWLPKRLLISLYKIFMDYVNQSVTQVYGGDTVVETCWDGRIWNDQWSQDNIKPQESVTFEATERVIEFRVKWRRKCSLLNFSLPQRWTKWSKSTVLVRMSFAKTLLCTLSDILRTYCCGIVYCCSDIGDNWHNYSLNDTVKGNKSRKQEEGLMISWQ
jgi:hypothetical protein